MGNNDEDRVPIIEARLLRTDDLIDLRLEATGCTLEPIDGGSELVCGPDSALVLHFPPQHIGEQVWQTMPAPPAPPPTPSQHVAAGPTRIVYQLAEGTRIPFTLDGVLAALPDLPLRVSKLATAAGEALDGAGPEPPADDETAIEAPYHLVVSPGPQGAFSHAVAPVGPPGRAELWRTRLTVRRDDGTLDDADAGRRIVRALWNRDQEQAPADFIPGSDDDQPLKPFDRYAIVAQTHGGIPENADTPSSWRISPCPASAPGSTGGRPGSSGRASLTTATKRSWAVTATCASSTGCSVPRRASRGCRWGHADR